MYTRSGNQRRKKTKTSYVTATKRGQPNHSTVQTVHRWKKEFQKHTFLNLYCLCISERLIIKGPLVENGKYLEDSTTGFPYIE